MLLSQLAEPQREIQRECEEGFVAWCAPDDEIVAFAQLTDDRDGAIDGRQANTVE